MNTAAELAAKLEERRKALRILYFIYGVGLVLVLVALFVYKPAALVITLMTLVYYFVLVRPKMKQLQLDFRSDNIHAYASRYFENFQHDAKKGVDVDTFNEAAVMPAQSKGFLSREEISGMVGDIQFYACDTAAHYTAPDGKKKNQIFWLCGTYLRAVFPEPLGYEFNLYHQNLLANNGAAAWARTSHPQWAELSLDQKAAEDFSAFGPEGNEVPSRILSRILKLQDYTTGPIAFHAAGNEAVLFIASRFLSLNDIKTILQTPITEAMVGYNTFPELEQVIDLMKACPTRE